MVMERKERVLTRQVLKKQPNIFKKIIKNKGDRQHGLELNNIFLNILDENKITQAMLRIQALALVHHIEEKNLGRIITNFQKSLNDSVKKTYSKDILQLWKNYQVLRKIDENEGPLGIYKELLESVGPMVLMTRIMDLSSKKIINPYIPKPKKQSILVELAKRMLYIYSPVAEIMQLHMRSGIIKHKGIEVLYSEQLDDVREIISAKEFEIKKTMKTFKQKINLTIEKYNEDNGTKFIIPKDRECRIKTPASIVLKMIDKKIGDVDSILDLIAITIVENSQIDEEEKIRHIYNLEKEISVVLMGNKTWLLEEDDHIKNPKNTGYQALHQNYKTLNGIGFEIQYKTLKMHEKSERGDPSQFHGIHKSNGRITKRISKNLNEFLGTVAMAKNEEELLESSLKARHAKKTYSLTIYENGKKRIVKLKFSFDPLVADLVADSVGFERKVNVYGKETGLQLPFLNNVKSGSEIEIMVTDRKSNYRKETMKLILAKTKDENTVKNIKSYLKSTSKKV
ncbi:hypothetical protein KAW38_04890 [Candidatus Micrarchaeota archaeon]|nr:hypothetical protein [Candidatus Micrarchaeota archaeon]